jgi:hypothetical protein
MGCLGGCQVQTSKEILNTIATAEAEVKNTIAIDDKQIDLILKEYSHLRDESWKAWHAMQIKQNGASWYIERCKIALAEGKDPKRYLTWLLKKDSCK